MVSKIILAICFFEMLLCIVGFLPIFPWTEAIDMLHNHSEYLSEEEKSKYLKKEKIYGIIITTVAWLFIIGVAAIIILSFLA